MTKRWRLEVQESFVITGRGLAVVGTLEGEAQQGEAAIIHAQDTSFEIEHVWFDFPRRDTHQFGVLLPGVGSDQISKGAVVESRD
jgi:hypothetical protein